MPSLGLGLGLQKLRKAIASFLPSNIAGLELWLDATDETTLNAKMGADFVSTSSEYLSSASADFDKGNESFSFGCWVKQDTHVVNAGIIGKYNATGNNRSYMITTPASGTFRIVMSNDGTSAITLDSAGHTITEWNFVVGVYDSVNDLQKLSVNGSDFITATNTTGAYISSTADFVLGLQTTAYLDGQIDGAFFYDKALTQDQVTSLYNSGNGKAYANLTADDLTSLVSWWQLNELSGNRSDSHGTNTLTDNNSVLSALGKIQEPIANNDYVWRWTDKSSNAYNFDQDTASSQPKWVNSGFGTESKPNLDFLATRFLPISSGSLSSNSAFTCFTVMQKASASGQIGGLMSSANTYTYLDYTDGIVYGRTQSGYDSASGQGHDTNTIIGIMQTNGTNDIILYKNETLLTSGYTNGAAAEAYTSIGNAIRPPNGTICEVIYYNKQLSENERLQVTRYLNNKYGIY
jgi:hypothetical protein